MDSALIIPVLMGWLSGWIVNYLADSLPITRRLSQPMCNQCSQKYSWIVYLTFGPCKNCGHRRGIRPWITQAALLIASLYTWFKPHHMGYWLGMLLLTYFAVVIVIDLEHRLILHPTSIVGAVIAFGIGISVNGVVITLLGGLAGLAIMLTLYFVGVLFSRFRARRLRARGQEADDEEALGAGDVILATILGFALGWPLIWFGLLFGILLGGIIGVVLIVTLIVSGRYGKQALMVFIPYGPFFVMSAIFLMFIPNWIVVLVPR
jgi:prepilin signal peptidase PulO-like enzyme (type II secretory pathway)